VLTDEGLGSTKSHSNDENNTQKKSNKETQVTIFMKRKYIQLYINKTEVHLQTVQWPEHKKKQKDKQ
jgi:hypothetical protein